MADFDYTCYESIPDEKMKVFDGCFKSALNRIGLRCSSATEQLKYNMTERSAVRKIHLDFLNAGASMIRTNTYWAAVPYMIRRGFSHDESESIIGEAVNRVTEASLIYCAEREPEPTILTVGSCGSATSCGHIPLTSSDNNVFKNYHRKRMETLLTSGVDYLAFESVQTSAEALAIMELMREKPNSYAWISFKTDNLYNLQDGFNLYNIASQCYAMSMNQIIAIGINCCYPEEMTYILNGFNANARYPQIPLIAYPKNYKRNNDNERWDMVDILAKYRPHFLSNIGLDYLGGGCNIQSKDIRELYNEIHKLPSQL